MKLGRKLAAVLVTLAMLLCLAPVAAFAATTDVTVGETESISLKTTQEEIDKADMLLEVATMKVEPNTVYRIQVSNLKVTNSCDNELYVWETSEDNAESDEGDSFSTAYYYLVEDGSFYLVTDENCTEVGFYIWAFAEDESQKITLDFDLKATESQYADKMVQVGQTKTLLLSQGEVDLGMTAYPLGSCPWQPYYDEDGWYDWYGCDTDGIVDIEYDESTGKIMAYPMSAGTTGVTLYLTNGKDVQKYYYKITVVNNYTKMVAGVPCTFVATQLTEGLSGDKVAELELPDTLSSYRVDVVYVGTPASLELDLTCPYGDSDVYTDLYQELPGITHKSFIVTPGTSAKYDLNYYYSNVYDSNDNVIPAVGAFTVTVTKAVNATAMKFDSNHYYGYILDGEQSGYRFNIENNEYDMESESVLSPVISGTVPLECTDLTSSDASIAKVTKDYKYFNWYTEEEETGTAIIPVAPGTATLTATMENGSKATTKFTSLETDTLVPGETYNLDDYQKDMNGEIWFTAKVPETGNYRLIVTNDECDYITGASITDGEDQYAWNYNYVSDEYMDYGDYGSQITVSNGDQLAVSSDDDGTQIKLVTEKEYVAYMKKLVTGHNWDTKYTLDEKATCSSEGMKSIHCTDEDCDASIAQYVIPALGHDWNKNNVCTRCGATLVKTTVEKGATVAYSGEDYGLCIDSDVGGVGIEWLYDNDDNLTGYKVDFDAPGTYNMSIYTSDDESESIDYVFIVK